MIKQLQKYTHKRFTLLNAGLKKYKLHAKPEQLHEVRVELKKIKTLFNFLAFSSKKFNEHKNYKPLKHIFKKAGLIRDVDVLHQLFKDYELEQFEKAVLPKEKNQNKLIEKFHKKTRHYIKTSNQSTKQMENYLANTGTLDLKDYISNTEHQLREKLFRDFKQDELHLIRKQLKELVYLSQIMGKKSTIKEIEIYDKLQNTIGDWHDKNVLIDILQKKQSSLYKDSVQKLKLGCASDLKLIKSLMNNLKLKHAF